MRLSSNNNIGNTPLEGKIISDGLEIAYLDWQAASEYFLLKRKGCWWPIEGEPFSLLKLEHPAGGQMLCVSS